MVSHVLVLVAVALCVETVPSGATTTPATPSSSFCPDSAPPLVPAQHASTSADNPSACFCAPGNACEPASECTRISALETAHIFNESCSNCTCNPVPTIFGVFEPRGGAVFGLGQEVTVVWDANAVVETLSIKVVRPTLDGLSTEHVVTIDATVPGSADGGTQSLTWPVPATIDAGNYMIRACLPDPADTTKCLPRTSQLSEVFSIEADGACPVGSISGTGNHPGCAPCAKGFKYVTPQRCEPCAAGTTTVALGDATCDQATDSPLAEFSLLRDTDLVSSLAPLGTRTGETAEYCATLCSLNKLCAAFEYRSGPPAECQFLYDTKQSSLSHRVEAAAGVNLYQKTAPVEPWAGFTEIANAFILGVVPEDGEVSLQGCAATCLESAECTAFVIGTQSRRGECFLITKANPEASIVKAPANAHVQLSVFVRQTENTCAAGFVSATSQDPGCVPCPVGSYADSATACSRCSPLQTTAQDASDSIDDCVDMTCPQGTTLNPPDLCSCPADTDCAGSGCADNAFDISCTDCECAERPPADPFIFNITSPAAGDVLFAGQEFSIVYAVTASTTYITLALYRLDSSDPRFVNLVVPIALRTRATGMFNWTIPVDEQDRPLFPTSDRAEYTIAIFHNPEPDETPAPFHRRTGFFAVQNLDGSPCPAGSINPNTGNVPCTKCDAGTFSSSTKECTPCPEGTTTLADGTSTIEACNINASNPLFFFSAPQRGKVLSGRNAGGSFVEAVDHKSVQECAQLCLDDAGCKSFDVGRPSTGPGFDPFSFQAGDCFLSYDNTSTGTLVSVDQLDFYEKRLGVISALERAFEAKPNCLLPGSDEGGIFLDDLYSPEACAQLCLNDVCCKSFEAGNPDSIHKDTCKLSFKDSTDNGVHLQCGPDVPYTLYEKVVFSEVLLPVLRDPELLEELDLAEGSNDLAVLGDALAASADMISGIDADDDIVKVTVKPAAPSDTISADTRLMARVSFASTAAQALFEEATRMQLVAFRHSAFVGPVFFASFGTGFGPCPAGHVSQTGDDLGSCRVCRENTYSNTAQTRCLPCPQGLVSEKGSTSSLQCTRPQQESADATAFVVGDAWLGSFETTIGSETVSGRLSVRVSDIRGTSVVQLLCRFTHGQPCDVLKGCRTPGVTEFYVLGRFLDGVFDRTVFDGWAGITDRSFPPQSFEGRVVVSADGEAQFFRGSFGPGTFDMTKQCSPGEDHTGVLPGDVWVGSVTCGGSQVQTHLRMELFVADVNNQTDTVSAVATIEYGNATGIYDLSGVFDPDSPCRSVQLTPGRNPWQQHPGVDQAVAFELSGRFSDDGVTYAGQLSRNPACACTGQSLPGDAFVGSSCAAHGGSDTKWCFVSPDCPEAVPSSRGTGLYEASCEDSCATFFLARTCSPEPLCDTLDGWQQHNERCYKFFDDGSSFSDAQRRCLNNNALLVSIHNNDENGFVCGLAGEGSQTVDGIWLGARKTEFSGLFDWEDDSPFGYERFADLTFDQDCASAVPTQTTDTCQEMSWVTSDCEKTLPFVCKKLTLGVESACDCVGISDSDGNGAACGLWGNEKVPWCYTSKFCGSAAAADNGLWRKECTGDPSFSCNGFNASTYTAPDGSCQPCATAASCAPNQVFVDLACSDFSTPACYDCDDSCASCSGISARNCLTCATGFSQFEDDAGTLTCVRTCPDGSYSDADGVCQPCDASCKTCSAAGPSACMSCDTANGLLLADADGNAACIDDCAAVDGYAVAAAGLCLPCDQCAAGTEYQLAPCTKDQNTQCARLTQCLPDQFELESPTETRDRQCRTWTVCRAGEEQVAAGSATSDRMCSPCARGTSDRFGNSTCVACPEGTTTAAVGTIGACDEEATLSCPVGQEPRDNVCTPCPPDTFKASAGSSMCRPHAPPCGPGFEETVDATASSDRECVSCVVPLTFKPGVSGKCESTTVCPLGTEEDTPPTEFSDRGCRPCAQGYFKPAPGLQLCRRHAQPCAPGQYDATPGTTGPNATVDRVCLPCPAGSYQDTADQLACLTHKTCNPGSFVATQPTAQRDRQCEACAPGTSSNANNARQCDACAPSSYQPAAGQAVCLPWSAPCAAGTEERRPPSATADRSCAGLGLAFRTVLLLDLDYETVRQSLDQFDQALKDAVLAMPTADSAGTTAKRTIALAFPNLDLFVQYAAGSVIADIGLSDAEAKAVIEEAVDAGNFEFVWDSSSVFASVAACAAGQFSSTGYEPCTQCPSGTTSPPKSSSVQACEVVTTRTSSSSSSGDSTSIAIGVVVAGLVIAVAVVVAAVIVRRRRTADFGTNVYQLPPVSQDGAMEFDNPMFTSDAPMTNAGVLAIPARQASVVYETVSEPGQPGGESSA
eukprot:m.85467 g.85467  ORF g.85467 m.85467 type:complete len:2344 (-) comp14846_c0_seq1:181-7212(-)